MLGLVQGLKDEEQPWQRKGEIVPRQHTRNEIVLKRDGRREEAREVQ